MNMTNTIIRTLALSGLLLAHTVASAESLVDGDAAAGKARAVTCAACHGPEGNSVMPTWPNIAGQGADYLLTQLQAFKSGNRPDPVMGAQVLALSEQDMKDLAVYFESLPTATQTVANDAAVDRAEALYRGGNSSRDVPACLACHGPSGRGNPAAGYPALKGQHAAYTAKQLRDYASGARKSDGQTRMMRDIAERLSAADIEALAAYVQGLK